MSIAERLVYIQQQEGLSASKFADLIGIQRSGLSHIYSGRNKPSIDFLQKLSSQFPKYRVEWILNGIEPVFKESNKADFSGQKDLFNDLTNNMAKSEDPQSYKPKIPEKGGDKSIPQGIIEDKLLDEPDIKEILIIYTNSTFKVLRPTNDK